MQADVQVAACCLGGGQVFLKLLHNLQVIPEALRTFGVQSFRSMRGQSAGTQLYVGDSQCAQLAEQARQSDTAHLHNPEVVSAGDT